MRVQLFLSSRSPESKRLEAFLASRPGLSIPITRIETREDAEKARRGSYPITTVPTLLTIDAPTPGEGQIAQMWVGYDKIMDFFASTAPARPPRDRNFQDEDGREGRRPQPRPRARVMDEPEDPPEDEDPYEEEPEDLEEEPPARAPKRKSKVGTPAQRRLAAKRLNRIAREEEPEERAPRMTGREEAARKAAAAKRPKKQRTKMDDTLELAKRQQEAARKTVPGKDFLA